MSVRIAARNGLFRLRTFHDGEEAKGSGTGSAETLEPAERLSFRGDRAGALHLLRSLASAPTGLLSLRALLGRRLPTIHRLEDAEVLALLATDVASGAVVVERVHAPALASYDVGETASESKPAEEVASQPKTWIEIELVDGDGKPVPYERYWILLTDGTSREGRLDEKGFARFDGLDPGECDVRFPDLDNEAVASPGEPKQPKGKPRPPPPPKKTWVEIALVGMDGSPIPGEAYKITLPDGSTREGVLDKDGRASVADIDPGQCVVTFPGLDQDAWETV